MLPDRSDAETARYLLFDAAVGLLASASADAPAVLGLDDLHWADRNTLLLLRHVIQATDPMRLLVVATYRDSDVTEDHPLTPLPGASGRESAWRYSGSCAKRADKGPAATRPGSP